MVGKGHLWSGSVSLIACSSVEIFLVHPHVDNFVNMIRLNESLQSSIVSNFVNIYDKIMMHFNDVNVMNLLFIGICVCCYCLGLLLPDIDSKDSTISKILHFHIPINHRGFYAYNLLGCFVLCFRNSNNSDIFVFRSRLFNSFIFRFDVNSRYLLVVSI